MTYEIYRNIFQTAAIAGGIMGIVSIILFFRLKIPSVIGNLTGTTARKGIEAIRTGNLKEPERKRLAGTKTGKLKTGRLRTEKLKLEKFPLESEVRSNETTVLPQSSETTVLSQVGETAVLLQSEDTQFEILQDITIIHTEEMIIL